MQEISAYTNTNSIIFSSSVARVYVLFPLGGFLVDTKYGQQVCLVWPVATIQWMTRVCSFIGLCGATI